ncbi:hypothetical protein CC1G_07879 [Coprinopsis cinerea okayama7|uniref:ER membrane protein complex subunit 6 n=1 Tax=Coprinopsis cinerea (strain Okayama-7 / 130 / ATCC MYA-4618 / FGSC 9003) TaxID=240176 RepID=A8P6J4_COPC7|nr:hypothetical protein CC1G_07879 [Coprinopsis cinerea okayama7\|eukprot:XP_001839164.2 hypothetical protein CC1G_07879 [Coprinopsis cinerea okayama7\
MSTTSEASAQLIYPPNVHANSALLNVKFLSACFAGAAAGILGLENLHGFALFLASTVLTSLCVGVVNCKGRVGKYVHGGWAELVNPGQDNAFTFVLVWTLFYARDNFPRLVEEGKMKIPLRQCLYPRLPNAGTAPIVDQGRDLEDR